MVSFEYELDGRLKKIWRVEEGQGAGVVATTDFTHDGMGRLQTLSHRNPQNSPIEAVSYAYDKASRLTQVASSRGSTIFAYDHVGQLLDAVYSSNHPLGAQDESFEFDELGNRRSADRDYGKTNKLFEDASFRYTYDKEGNLLTKTHKATGQVTEHAWDHRGRLTRVQVRASAGSSTILSSVDYRYDSFDRRIEKSVNTDGVGPAEIVEKFVYEGEHIALVFDGDGTLTHRYMHGPGIDMILADEAFDGTTGNFIDVYWTLADHQGSVTSVLSYNSGQTSVVQQIAYTAFGSIGSIRDGQGNAVTTGPLSRFGYTGREFDPETGNYFYRARYYDAQTGRFLSEDPIGFAAGDLNLYRYVGNSTPNFTDPSGLVAASTSGPRPNPPYPKPPTWTTNEITPISGPTPPPGPTGVPLPGGGSYNPDPPPPPPQPPGDWPGTYGPEDRILGPGLGPLVECAIGIPLVYAAGTGISAAGVASKGVERVVVVGVRIIGDKITGYTRHGLEQAIGRDGGRGVSPSAIIDALRNPLKTISQPNGCTRYEGKNATVVLNNDGKLITTWPRNRAGVRGGN